MCGDKLRLCKIHVKQIIHSIANLGFLNTSAVIGWEFDTMQESCAKLLVYLNGEKEEQENMNPNVNIQEGKLEKKLNYEMKIQDELSSL